MDGGATVNRRSPLPLYAIIARDRADAGTLRADTRPAHLDYLTRAGDRIERAGPLLDEEGVPTGSLLVVRFDDLAAARAFAAADPYAVAGLFAEASVTAWRQVLP